MRQPDVLNRIENWRVRRLARRWVDPPIQPGEWLLDLGMPTPRAVRIKKAYELQQDTLAHLETPS